MSFSPAVDRESLHTRRITCQGFLRQDGLWDIEGYLLDSKDHDFTTADKKVVTPGQALHYMGLRLTIDHELNIVAAEVDMVATPTSVCQDIRAAYDRLVGLRIGPGFSRKVKELLGGIGGCTHLTELLGPLATTAFQTLSHRFKHDREKASGTSRPPLLDACHAFRADGPLAAQLWPDAVTQKT
ncbi:MAG: DUF2889 domain-containing protein [Magnetospirillum sp.]